MINQSIKKGLLYLAVGSLTSVVVGCAITDYGGWAQHKTVGEAKLWGKDVAFSGFGQGLDGTYAYTVKYDNRPGKGSGKVTVTTYYNPEFGAFSRDGIVNRDGDNVQGKAGSTTSVPATPKGQFQPKWVAVDSSGACNFDSNIKQNAGPDPIILLCIFGGAEENDFDFDLQTSFASLDGLMAQIWSGALGNEFNMDITSLVLNGKSVGIESLPISVSHNGVRPINVSISNGQGAQSAIQAILANTDDGVPVSVGLNFAGGMSVGLPAQVTVAFNHDALRELLDEE